MATPPTRTSGTLHFEMLGQSVEVRYEDAVAEQVVRSNYAALQTAARRDADVRVAFDPAAAQSADALGHGASPPGVAGDAGECLFALEKHLVVALQQRRPELLFLHAAALSFGGRVWLLVGDSGHGKSTTAWGLLHHGFEYLSDELAPIDLARMQVHGYPHALCLKRAPPAGYPLPAAGVMDLGDTLHVPTASLPAAVANAPLPLAGLLFVRYRPERVLPVLRAVTAAEAAARLYTTTLNALAHPGQGLDAVLRIAEAVPCHVLGAAGLRETCELVLRHVSPPGGCLSTRPPPCVQPARRHPAA